MPVEEQQKTLNAKLRGHYLYYGRPTNYQSIWRFFREVRHIWRKWLSRRTRGNGMTWEKCAAIPRKHPLLLPRIHHPWGGAGSRDPVGGVCEAGERRRCQGRPKRP